MTNPIALSTALAAFQDLWSPRILTHVNDYDVRLAKVRGEFIWHTHTDTDEFFLVLEGEVGIGLREDGAERVVTLPRGSVFVVPRGVEHRPFSAAGASVLLFEPTGTVNVGDAHEEVPGHITATTGERLGGAG
ncbi:cupin domain-containing protein [Crossiella cryophila]|uniref:Mannose-6-phosphate isomerase-like protein (Cupin superfamily) n=1 Tax=Crossiella cryophila TaxID=43355 RepID=A0A7W7FXW2_9PSEU|nr:cupin domain-containing protein [Crossiella cryophila]MBB4679404.1 mannose-6-phosphate isomerase-like protein (cupin superfamily) [Crossiella cryophila]